MYKLLRNKKRNDHNYDPSVIGVHPLTQNPTMAWDEIKVKTKFKKIDPLSLDTPIDEHSLRVVCVSDTHSTTSKDSMVDVPYGDVLLHAGDFTMIGTAKEIIKFNKWLGTQPHRRKVVIAGNHDLMFDDALIHEEKTIGNTIFGATRSNLPESEQILKDHNLSHVSELLTNCIYLKDSNVDICGINIYGSPWQPRFGGWAFNLERGQQCLDFWNMIPDNTDILMTHGPPIGHGDLCKSGIRAGCVELLQTIQKRVKPKYHVFGHIHEDGGVTTDGHTVFINACTCDYRYKPVITPTIFDIPIPVGRSKEEILEDFDINFNVET